MILVKSTEGSESGGMPSKEILSEQVAYHEELANARALYDATGLRPISQGWRIKYSGGTRTIEGPFTEADQIAGYTIIQVGSRDEAMGSAMRYAQPGPRGGGWRERDPPDLRARGLRAGAGDRAARSGTLDRIAVDVERSRPDLASATAPNGPSHRSVTPYGARRVSSAHWPKGSEERPSASSEDRLAHRRTGPGSR
jgi:hypothetical protein